jgi:hypothetical protein
MINSTKGDVMAIAVKTIKAKGKIKNGHLVIEEEAGLFPQDGEVEVTVLIKAPTLSQSEKAHKQLEFEAARQDMQQAFKEAGIETREQILELIQDVKREMYEEKNC